MCGKSNPADSEICLHCGAQIQLKHFNGSEDELASPADDQISWLKDLQQSSEQPGFADEQTTYSEDADAEMPDWLTRIRERSRFEEQAAVRAAVDQQQSSDENQDEGVPEWMQDASQTQPDKPAASLNDADWLGSLRSVEISEPKPEDQQVEQFDAEQDIPSEDQVIDRLSALGADSAAVFDEAPSETSDEYVDREEPSAEEETFSETAEDNLEDWLSQLDTDKQTQETAGQDNGIPDWLGSSSDEDDEDASFSQDQESKSVPDWLKLDREIFQDESSLDEETLPQSVQPEQDQAAITGDVPDWLQSLEPQSPTESDHQTEDTPDEGPSDWFSEIEDEVFEEASTKTPGESETPDWFGEMGTDQTAESEASEIPGWLSGLETTPSEQESPDSGLNIQDEKEDQILPEEVSPGQKDSAPGFEDDLEEQLLAEAVSLSGLSGEVEPSEIFSIEKDVDVSQESFMKEKEEIPSTAEENLFESEEELAEPGAVSPFLAENLPNWLSEISGEDLDPSESEKAPAFTFETDEVKEVEPSSSYPFSIEDMPEWLSEEAGLQGVEGTLEEAKEDVEIAPAQMPSWLQAMRPVEAVAPGKSRSRKPSAVEKAGPLAGLQGILPAEDLATQYRKPPVYSSKLHVSENQRTHADLFENVLEQESQSKAIRTEGVQIPQRVVRLVIAALLIGVLVLPMLVSPFSKPLALSYPPESVIDFYQQVEALPDSVPVLVAFDYDPGFSGEMRFSAVGVLEKLISKRARIASVSTVAQGPVLGENLLQNAYQRASSAQPGLAAEYTLDQQTINLGYLAGGLASLQEFSVRPKQAVQYGFDSGLDGELVWRSPVLQGINEPDDFAMVIVVTDSVDTGRSWIEQVQPVLGSTPMLLVTSAQASPMFLPYLQSGQVQGLLSGMSGGIAYERLSGSSELSSSYFNSYQYAMILGVAFVLLGLFFKILVSMFARRKAKGEA